MLSGLGKCHSGLSPIFEVCVTITSNHQSIPMLVSSRTCNRHQSPRQDQGKETRSQVVLIENFGVATLGDTGIEAAQKILSIAAICSAIIAR